MFYHLQALGILWFSYFPFHLLFLDYTQRGRADLAEEELEKLMGASHVKYAIAEMSKTDKGDEVDNVRFGELLYGRHFKGIIIVMCFHSVNVFLSEKVNDFITFADWTVVFMGSALFALQQLSGINAVFYFSSTVFKKAGVPSDIANTCVGIVNLTGNSHLSISNMYNTLGNLDVLVISRFTVVYNIHRVYYCNDFDG